ncbi:hypothetical protein GCM10010300_53420 [Streptomyces olivaceoviridis]|nr:hypothetical protein GCM10010300_53420 [Streptomyces olivaceoviridis]
MIGEALAGRFALGTSGEDAGVNTPRDDRGGRRAGDGLRGYRQYGGRSAGQEADAQRQAAERESTTHGYLSMVESDL